MKNTFRNEYIQFTIPDKFSVINDKSKIIFKLRYENFGILPEIVLYVRPSRTYQLPVISHKNPFDDNWIPDKKVTDVSVTKIKEKKLRGYTLSAVIHSEKHAQLWGGPIRKTEFERFKDNWEVCISIQQRLEDTEDPIKLADALYQSIVLHEKSADFYFWYSDERRLSDIWPG